VHTHLLRAALAATVVLLPVRSEAQPTSTGTRPPHATAQAFVGELFAHRQELSLTRPQVDSLTALASRIRADRSRLQTAGLDRVPGKSVPRFARVYPVRRAARDMAFRLPTPNQRVEADRFLHDRQPAKTARR
jgi:hypothetical protein